MPVSANSNGQCVYEAECGVIWYGSGGSARARVCGV